MYDLAGNITSPFYHKLHIAQLTALSMIYDNDTISLYLGKWKKDNKNIFKKIRAFIKKANQKIRE